MDRYGELTEELLACFSRRTPGLVTNVFANLSYREPQQQRYWSRARTISATQAAKPANFTGLSAKPCRGQQRKNKVSRMLLPLLALALSLSFGNTIPTEQKTLISQPGNVEISTGGQDAVKGRALQGRFLHITGTPDRDPAAAWWSPSDI